MLRAFVYKSIYMYKGSFKSKVQKSLMHIQESLKVVTLRQMPTSNCRLHGEIS